MENSMLYLALLFISWSGTYCIRKIALKKSLLAIPNERSSHSVPTPHGGGIAIALTWLLGLIYLFMHDRIDATLFYALLIGFGISIVSFLDDMYELKAKTRLCAQALVSAVGLYLLGGLSSIDFGFFILQNPWITNALAFFGIIWFINLYNFLDGIDGYAGMEAVFLAFGGGLLFGGGHFIVLAVSVLGFLVWNWHKAKIFMGDVGSTLLGYTIAIFALYYQNNGTSIFVWLILFGLFWFDATLTLVRRYRNHESLSMAHRKHAYQRAVQSGLTHAHVVLLGLAVNAILFILSYSAFSNPKIILGIFCFAIVFLYAVVYWVDKRRKFE